jgi:hypothetical protein
VTYNIRDYVVLAQAAAAAGREHWGIVLISARTIPASDIGGLVRALQAVLAERPAADALKKQTISLPAASS